MYKPKYQFTLTDSSDNLIWSSQVSDERLARAFKAYASKISSTIAQNDGTIILKVEKINKHRTWFKLHSV